MFNRLTQDYSDLPLLLAIALTGMIYSLTLFNYTLSYLDEGFVLYGSLQTLKGQIPYRDFWTLYMPGTYYLLAFLFKLFGPSVIGGRYAMVILHGLMAAVVYLLAKRMAPKRFALISTALYITWGIPLIRSLPRSISWGMFFALLGILSMESYISYEKKGPLFLAGILTGVTLWFRIDVAVYVILSVAISLLVLQKLTAQSGKINRSVFMYGVGLIVPIIPLLIYFYKQSALIEMVKDAVLFPLLVVPKIYWLPFPWPTPNILALAGGDLSIKSFLIDTLLIRSTFYFPIAIYLLTACYLVYRLVKREFFNTECLILPVLIFGILSFSVNVVVTRADIWHSVPVMAPSFILAGFLLNKIASIKKRRPLYSLVLHSSIALLLLFISLGVFHSFFFLGRVPFMWQATYVPAKQPRARGMILEKKEANALNELASFVHKITTSKEKIFVFGSPDILLYLLLERDAPTKFYSMDPGFTKPTMQTIVSDLEKAKVKCVIFSHRHLSTKQERESYERKFDIVSNYIRANFYVQKRFGCYEVLLRKTSGPARGNDARTSSRAKHGENLPV